MMICLFVLTQLTNVIDTRTHTHTDTHTPHDGRGRAMHSIAATNVASLFLAHSDVTGMGMSKWLILASE